MNRFNNDIHIDHIPQFIHGGFPIHDINISGVKFMPDGNHKYEISVTYFDGLQKKIKNLPKSIVEIYHDESGLARPNNWHPHSTEDIYQKYQSDPGPYQKDWEYRGNNTYIYDTHLKK